MTNIHRIVRAACVVLSVATGICAEVRASDSPSATVRYHDLDVTTADGVRVLYQRLRAASRQVCRAYDSRELDRFAEWRACYDRALTDAVTQLDLPSLTAAHSRTGAHAGAS